MRSWLLFGGFVLCYWGQVESKRGLASANRGDRVRESGMVLFSVDGTGLEVKCCDFRG